MTTNVQDNSLTISGTISRDSGFYTCVVTNGLDEERASAILTVKGNWELKISKLQFVSKCIVSDSYLAPREQFSSYTMTRTSYFLMGAVMVVIVWLLDLQLPMQSVPITTSIVSSNPAQARCTQNNIIW